MQKIYTLTNLSAVWLYSCICVVLTSAACHLDLSRVVREQITEQLPTLLTTPSDLRCPLTPARDVYERLEANKMEDSSWWGCLVCGKQFYEQRFLDQHLQNRHSHLVRNGAESVCLADFCDIFRCDVLLRRTEQRYWGLALCRENDLHRKKQRCLTIMHQCMSEEMDKSSSRLLQDEINSVCDYLSCEKYWDMPNPEMDPLSIVAYIMATIVLAMALMLYYYVAYTHFYTDDSLLVDFSSQSTTSYYGNRYPGARSAARKRANTS